MRGTLVLVVGPSGAGKDTVIAGARARLAGDRRFVFARRVVTRPADGEGHRTVAPAEFDAMAAAGEFLLHWQAHGTRYAIPAEIGAALAAGRHAVANVSRTVLAEARRRLQPLAVVCVTAPPALLAERLAARGRDTPAQIAARLCRRVPTAGDDVTQLVNDGPPPRAVERFLAVLRALP